MNKIISKFYIFVYRMLYNIYSKKPINNKQCVFCSMESNDAFGNLLGIKDNLSNDFTCFSCFGKINSLYKANRVAKKIATSKFIFLNAAYTYTSIINIRRDAKVIQLWHAAGAFKKFGMHSISLRSKKDVEKQHKLHGYYDYVIVSSDAVVNTYADAFQMDKSHVLPLGLPRIQKLVEQNSKCKEYRDWLCNKYEKLWYKKIILYAPTFRENKGKRDYKPSLNIKNFASQLPDDYILAIKLHPRAPKSEVKYPANVVDFTKLPQNMALICSDVLITDYSSVVFDFAALDKPVFFYTPDEVMYNRGLYFSPKKDYPCITFVDYYDLVNTIISIFKNYNSYKTINLQSKRISDKYINNYNNSIYSICNFVHEVSVKTEV